MRATRHYKVHAETLHTVMGRTFIHTDLSQELWEQNIQTETGCHKIDPVKLSWKQTAAYLELESARSQLSVQ